MRSLLVLILGISQLSAYKQHGRISNHDVLRLKCDALPYRSHFSNGKCYFARSDKISFNAALSFCPSILSGAILDSHANDDIFGAMFLDKSKFHCASDSSTYKKVLCSYAIIYTCPSGLSSQTAGKCAARTDRKMNYKDAEAYCARTYGGSLPFISNDDWNRDISSLLGASPAWLQHSYSSKGNSPLFRFSRWTSCSNGPSSVFSAQQTSSWCSLEVAAILNGKSDNFEYWRLSDVSNLMDVVCERNANSEFWTEEKRSDDPGNGGTDSSTCHSYHNYDSSTKKCIWNGEKDGCVFLTSVEGKTIEITNPNYPNLGERDIYKFNQTTNSTFNDKIVKAVVRNGCVSSFFSHTTGGFYNPTLTLLYSKPYGVYDVPAFRANTLNVSRDGLTRISCDCSLGALPAPVNPETAKEKCLAHHRFEPSTGRCEWTLEMNICAELTSETKGQMFVKIPTNKYPAQNTVEIDIFKQSDTALTFNDRTVKALVRQGCTATFFSHTIGGNWNPELTLLNDVGYGNYDVPCLFTKTVVAARDGLTRIECKCDDAAVRTPKKAITPQKCLAHHRYEKTSQRCEWTREMSIAVELRNFRNETVYINIPNFPKTSSFEIDIFNSNVTLKENFNDKTIGALVRQGCVCTFYSHTPNGLYNKYLSLYHKVAYGEYVMPSAYTQGAKVKESSTGLTRIACECDSTNELTSKSSTSRSVPEKTVVPLPNLEAGTGGCTRHHRFEVTSNRCEWIENMSNCLEMVNKDKKTMFLSIPGYPKTKKVDFNLYTNSTTANEWNDRINEAVIRQGCKATFYAASATAETTLPKSGYGLYTIPSFYNGKCKNQIDGTTRIVCECDY